MYNLKTVYIKEMKHVLIMLNTCFEHVLVMINFTKNGG